MKVGTKSVLFGVHQFIWHPITVTVAWIVLYKRAPSIKEIFCILIHDLGYFGKENMDGKLGEKHPEFAAKVAGFIFGDDYRNLCLLHSRHYSRILGKEPSKLCWADKLSIRFDPRWFYLLRASASGELEEYKHNAEKAGFINRKFSNIEWFEDAKAKMVLLSEKKRGDAVRYLNDVN
jgi:hypothetical protein